jgi:hypothetical protein
MPRSKRKTKARQIVRRTLERLEDLPNIGPSLAADLRQVGIEKPNELPGQDPYVLYDMLCGITGVRHDPCVLDTFISAVRFMEGAPPHPWWHYTAERKRTLGKLSPVRSV